MYVLQRTELALEEIKKFLEAMPEINKNPLISNYLAQYLCVCFYSEMEDLVTKILINRLSLGADQKIKFFAENTTKNWAKKIAKSDIAKFIKYFGDDCSSTFNESVLEKDVQLYSSVILNRHQASHGKGSNITIGQIEEAMPAAIKILEKIECALK